VAENAEKFKMILKYDDNRFGYIQKKKLFLSPDEYESVSVWVI
jgi:hypothetical protein